MNIYEGRQRKAKQEEKPVDIEDGSDKWRRR